MQVSGSHSTQTETGAVDIVTGNHCIDRTNIHFARMLFATCFHEILDQRLGTEDDVFETWYLLNPVHEYVHVALFLGERNLPNLGPVFITLGQHIGFLDNISFQTEKPRFYLIEFIIRIFGGTLHFQSLNAFHKNQFHRHIIVGQHPVTVGQLLIFLNDIHIIHKVHPRSFGQIHGTAFHCIRRVFHHIQMSGKAKVLRILRYKSQVHTLLFVHHQGIHQIIFVESNGSPTDGAHKTALQQTDIIIVDINVRKDIIQDSTQHIAGIEELFDTG